MASQFKSPHDVSLLGDLLYPFPEGTHAIGRLDKCSEGLLLLTTNKKITALLFQSKVPHKRTYLVQVRFAVSSEKLQLLRTGVTIPVTGGGTYVTQPCEVEIVAPPGTIFPPPLDVHPNVEHTWLRITLTEGKFRQIRKMVAAINHRCMRLIRISIEDLALGELAPGSVKEISEWVFFSLLKLGDPVD